MYPRNRQFFESAPESCAHERVTFARVPNTKEERGIRERRRLERRRYRRFCFKFNTRIEGIQPAVYETGRFLRVSLDGGGPLPGAASAIPTRPLKGVRNKLKKTDHPDELTTGLRPV